MRRAFLAAGPAMPLAQDAAARSLPVADSAAETCLVAGPAREPLLGRQYQPTDVWASVPGPDLRFRQGQRARIAIKNRLNAETSVHWHGVRVPNAMDGVPVPGIFAIAALIALIRLAAGPIKCPLTGQREWGAP